MHALESISMCAADVEPGPGPRTPVSHVMSLHVKAIRRDAGIHEATRLLQDQALPGLPVVDPENRVVGVLSEHDLVTRLAPPRRRPWWHLVVEAEQLAREYRKTAGITVGEVMTHPARTVSPATDLEAAARLFDDPAVTLIPVVMAERLVGVLCRRDLVRALASTPARGVRRTDADLVAEMRARMVREAWITNRPVVHACNGVLALWGVVGGEAEKAALLTMARAIPGCSGVEDHLVALGSGYPFHAIV
jgi:CBS domain-containing protein